MALAFLNKCASMHAGHPNRCFWVWTTVSFIVVSVSMARLELNHFAAVERDRNLAAEVQELRVMIQELTNSCRP